MITISKTEVQALGFISEHKVKAILSDGTWLTYYINTGMINHHCPVKGGLGRHHVSDLMDQSITNELMEIYKAYIANVS